MQLVAYGAQDIYLTGQPQITFFKAIYRRHTNFAVESIQQTINGNSIPGGRVTVTVSRNGDLLKNLWVEYDPSNLLPKGTTGYVAADLGHALFNQLELEIGGQLIDKHYGKWLTIWRELTEVNPTGSKGRLHWGGAEPTYTWGGDSGANEPETGDSAVWHDFVAPTLYQRMSYTHLGYYLPTGDLDKSGLARAPKRAYVPMAFWFCRNPGLAIPLIALQYHEVKFNINYANLDQLFLANTGVPTVNYSSIQIYADYIYLDTTERRQFAQNAHEYLIDQLQVQSGETQSTIRLNFNHPVKELIFTGTPVSVKDGSFSGDTVLTGGATPSQIVSDQSTDAQGVVNDLETSRTDLTMRLVLNGTDRFTDRHITYFTRNQIWDSHTGYGSQSFRDAIGVYSFALRPEEHQPSGTCNFSRIDNAQMKFGGTSASNLNSLDIYAVNYNVLRIMSGMGGLAYSN